MASIIVSNIPEFSERADVVRCLQHFIKPNQLEYVLYPLGKEKTKALASFATSTSAEAVLKKTGYLFGARLIFRPAPLQVYTRCSALVDPAVAASISDPRQLMRKLRSDFGLTVSMDDNNSIVLTGSLPQIECAQLKLDEVRQDLQERQRQDMLLLGQDIDTPRSQRARSPDPLEVEFTRASGGYHTVKHFTPSTSLTHSLTDQEREEAMSPMHSIRRHEEEHVRSQPSSSRQQGHVSAPARSTYRNKAHAQDVKKSSKSSRYNKTTPVKSLTGTSGGLPMTLVSLSFVADAHLIDYIRQIYWEEVNKIEQTNHAQIFYERDGNLTTVLLKPLPYYAKHPQEGSQESQELALAEAKHELVGLYQTVFYAVVKECLRYDANEVDLNRVEASVSAVRTAFATTATISCRKAGEIIVVGNSDSVMVIAEWIATKLNISSLDKSVLEPYSYREPRQPKSHKKRLAATWTAPEVKAGTGQPSVSRSHKDAFREVDTSLVSGASALRITRDPIKLKDLYEFETTEGLVVKVCQGDIAGLSVDVVVNPANENLQLIGGVSGALKRAGGAELQRVCDMFVRRNGALKVGEVTSMRAVGTMKCSHVLHVVGPMWHMYADKDQCAQTLYQTLYNALSHANDYIQAEHIALPPVSAGIYGVPLDVCMGTLYQAVTDISQELGYSRVLREVMVVALDPSGAETAALLLQQLHEQDASENDSQEHSPEENIRSAAVTNVHVHSGSPQESGSPQVEPWVKSEEAPEYQMSPDASPRSFQESSSPPPEALPLGPESPLPKTHESPMARVSPHLEDTGGFYPGDLVETGTDVPGPSLADNEALEDSREHMRSNGEAPEEIQPQIASESFSEQQEQYFSIRHHDESIENEEAERLSEHSGFNSTREEQLQDHVYVSTQPQNGGEPSPGARESQDETTDLSARESKLLEAAFSPHGSASPREGSLRASVVLESANEQTEEFRAVHEVPLLARLLANGYCIAQRAADIIRDILKQGELGIVEKGVNDFQTEADRSAERCIVASFAKKFPGVTLISEEDIEQSSIPDEWIETSEAVDILQYANEIPEDLRKVKEEDIVIWIDPLDGTSEYTIGLLDHVTVLIGIAVKGQPVAGIIGQPYYNYELKDEASLGRVAWGVVGVGAFGLNPAATLPPGTVVATSRSHSDAVVEAAIEAVHPTEVLRVGGSGHKVLLILEGKAHVYLFASRGCKKWDTCAPEAVLRAMGGALTDLHGNSYQYFADVEHPDKGGVLATAEGQNHRHYSEAMPQEILDRLPTSGPAPWQ